MSELKVIDLGNIRESIEKGESVYYEYYPKSEADKVIANRDYEIKNLKDSIGKLLKAKTEQVITEVMQNALIYGEGFIRVQDAMKLIAELHHQKYKRCLAMVKYCHESAMWLEECGVIKYATFMLRWQKRWLELAERFK